MNLCHQIKKYRTELHLSQKELAEKIYVSTQTISNWENERSYPDIQNLLLMSVLFDVTLDDLVKGDVEEMKQTIESKKFVKLTWIWMGVAVLSFVSIAPSFKFFGFKGLIIPLVLILLQFLLGMLVEREKKQHNLQTYSEILNFIDNREISEEQIEKERKHFSEYGIIVVISVLFICMCLMAVSFFFFFKVI